MQITLDRGLHRAPRAGAIDRHALKAAAERGSDGFIRHPVDFPIQVRRLWFNGRSSERPRGGSRLGLCFDSEDFVRPGSLVELSIPLRGDVQKFRGEVVLVRETGFGYEIGVWLQNESDAARARIVEQICHIETYLREKREREGRQLSRERAAREWIAKFAASFPVF
jgi:hypothetical protein